MVPVPYQHFQPIFAPCYICGVYGHLSTNCPQQALAQQNIPNYLRSILPAATAPYVSRPNTPPSVLPQAFLPNSPQDFHITLLQITQLANIYGMKLLIK